MKEIVVNRCYGGFSLSKEAVMEYGRLKGINIIVGHTNYRVNHYYIDSYDENNPNNNYFSYTDIERDDPDLVSVVKSLGDKANGELSNLQIVEIPKDCKYWEIDDYDGMESVVECHRSW